ncbi:MAG TPA: hypothetical protein VI792_03850, partial [Candidatus Eisenbacteria bacterium]
MKPRGRFAGGRTRRGRWPLLLGALAALALLALYLSGHRHEEAHHAEPDLGAQADSLNAATRRHDWQAAEQWASRLAAAQPRNHEVLYELALSIHNRATAMTPRFGRPRPSLRLSLDRIAAEVRVMALLDSAARVSPSPEGWASAQLLRGMALEGLGLPIDALEVYRAALDRTPDLAAATV